MLKNICSKSASVRQASVYGVGVMAQCAAEHFTPACLGMFSGKGEDWEEYREGERERERSGCQWVS